jgi:hypothetical protein
MNSRIRFERTMSCAGVDRPPLLEEGLRDDVTAAWRQQGLASGNELTTLAGYDRRERIEPQLRPSPEMSGPILTGQDLAELARRLDASDASRLPADWAGRVPSLRRRDFILDLLVHRGFFQALGARAWASFEPAVLLVRDDPALVRDVMDTYGAFAEALVRRITRDVVPDMATFSEPIGGNDRPLISPRDYGQLVLPSYQPAIAALREAGVRTLVFATYANSAPLMDAVLDAGFDTLWAMEAEGQAMDYRRLRQRYGSRLGLIGGIDLDVLLRDPAAIDRELEEKVPALLAQGRYIPLADGRVRSNMPLANYLHYRRRLAQLCAGN